MRRVPWMRPLPLCLAIASLGAFAVATFTPGVAQADDLIEYTVKKGDTCAAIAQRQWGDARRVDLIHDNNPNMGPAPHNLKEGTVLRIPRVLPAAPSGGPDAKLTHYRNKVTTLTPEPAPAVTNAPLNRGNRVTTEDQSAAQVTFKDESQIELGEKTLVVILGDMRANAAKTANVSDTTLVTGSLRSKLGQLSGAKPPVIATEGARVTLGRGQTQISVDEKKSTRLAVYDGQSTLSAQKKDVVVPTNFGSKAELGKPPTPPKPLPGAPIWKNVLPVVTFTQAGVAEVKATYQRGTTGDAPAKYHVQIARDEAFLEIVTDVDVPETITELDAKNLAVGDYHVRVSAIDADRFEGPFTADSLVRVVSLRADGATWTQSAPVGTALAGLTCSIDGGPMGAVPAETALDRFHAHDLACSRPGGTPTTAHVAAEHLALAWSLRAVDPKAHTAVLVARAEDDAKHPIEHLTLSVKPEAGVDVDVFSAPSPGTYEAKISWTRGVSQLTGKAAANGEAHESLALALPTETPDDSTLVLTPAPVKTSFGEFGLEAGFTGATSGIGPVVALRGGVRQDVGKLEISVNAQFGMEARSSDETGALPTNLTGGTTTTSYATSERVYFVGVPVEARYKLGKSPFSAGLGLTPFIAIENANVAYFGGNVALHSPNTLFGVNVLAVGHLAAGPGTITLNAGLRVSTTRDREVENVDLLGPYVTLGYRFAL